ncbi:hypothetical protein MKW92_016220 [Papaver armeniacum]|nr:hypothetical protein MKW92_016220 [Papaver armeniacum]
MNPSTSLLSFISSLFIVFLVLNFHSVKGDLISDVCKYATKNTKADLFTLEYDYCVTSLSANAKSKNADLRGLGVISMQTCLQNATSIHSYIGKIFNDGKTRPDIKPIITFCLDLYSDAIRSVQKATASFKSKDYRSANTQLNVALDDSLMCEYGFREILLDESPVVSPFTKQNGDFFRLAGISIAITNMV